MHLILALERQRHVDFWEIKASLAYIVSPVPASVTF